MKWPIPLIGYCLLGYYLYYISKLIPSLDTLSGLVIHLMLELAVLAHVPIEHGADRPFCPMVLWSMFQHISKTRADYIPLSKPIKVIVILNALFPPPAL